MATAVAVGASADIRPASAHGTLVGHNEINGQNTYLFNRTTNVMGTSPYTFQYNSTFYSRLEAWEGAYYSLTPGHWIRPTNLGISDIHRDTLKPSGSLSMHAYGRAMDIERIYMTDSNTGSTFLAANLRGNQLSTATDWKRYWAAVASLNYYFDYVLHWHSGDHTDHVHADNEINGSADSNFRTGSQTQVTFLQASLNRIWGKSLAVDGSYGPLTRDAAADAVRRLGLSGYITTQNNWLTYCRGTTMFGTGRATF